MAESEPTRGEDEGALGKEAVRSGEQLLVMFSVGPDTSIPESSDGKKLYSKTSCNNIV